MFSVEAFPGDPIPSVSHPMEGKRGAVGGTLEGIPAAHVLRELRQVRSLGLSVPICAVGSRGHSTCPGAA